jgi:hypothetical protein
MKHRRSRWIVTALFAGVTLLLAACQGSADEASDQAAVVEEVQGADVSRITLTPQAAGRLDIKTSAVERKAGATVIPYAALYYSPTGETWTYTNPEGLTFVRQRIAVDRIDGNRVVLSKGPPPGTKIATVGVAELYGAESGIGGDSGH